MLVYVIIEIWASEESQIYRARPGEVCVTKWNGFEIDETTVRCVIENPSRLDSRGNQLLALKPMDQEHAVRVVYEKVNDNIVVITFYPVKRVRFHV